MLPWRVSMHIHVYMSAHYRVCMNRVNTEWESAREWIILIQIHSRIHSIRTFVWFSLWFLFVGRADRKRERETPHKAADTNVSLREQQREQRNSMIVCVRRCMVFFLSKHYMCFWFFFFPALFGLLVYTSNHRPHYMLANNLFI